MTVAKTPRYFLHFFIKLAIERDGPEPQKNRCKKYARRRYAKGGENSRNSERLNVEALKRSVKAYTRLPIEISEWIVARGGSSATWKLPLATALKGKEAKNGDSSLWA
jgi:hypothetical protein